MLFLFYNVVSFFLLQVNMSKARRASVHEHSERTEKDHKFCDADKEGRIGGMLSFSSMPDFSGITDSETECVQVQARPWRAQESMLTPDDHIIWYIFS